MCIHIAYTVGKNGMALNNDSEYSVPAHTLLDHIHTTINNGTRTTVVRAKDTRGGRWASSSITNPSMPYPSYTPLSPAEEILNVPWSIYLRLM